MDRNSLTADQSKLSSENQVSRSEDFLRTEYELLNQWAVHGEDVAHRIFNFYITLLTAVLGGVLVASQALSPNTQSVLIIVAGACGFLLSMGVGFYDGLVSQYIRNVYYHSGMQLIRTHFRRYQEIASSLQEPPFILTGEAARFPGKFVAHRLMRVTFGFPGGNQLTLIGGINSLLVAVIVLCLVWGIAGIGFRLVETILAAILCACTSLVLHSMLSNLMVKRNMAQMQSDRVLGP